MLYSSINWLIAAGFATSFFAAQPLLQSPTPSEIRLYASKIDGDKKITVFRHIQTYGHPLNPGKDSLFWAYSTDFPGSVSIYYSAQRIVKIQEIARTSVMFCENNYYFKSNKLLLVKSRQVHCSLPNQRAIWFKNAPVCDNKKDCFFSGSYYFANDSCFAQQQEGIGRWEPHRANTHGRLSPGDFFPWQAARYVAAFTHSPRH